MHDFENHVAVSLSPSLFLFPFSLSYCIPPIRLMLYELIFRPFLKELIYYFFRGFFFWEHWAGRRR